MNSGRAAKLQNGPAVVQSQHLRGDSIRVQRLATALGADVLNVDLRSASKDPALIAELRKLLLAHKVLFFRDQEITAAQHVAFAKCFGELEVHPVFDHHPEHSELVLLYRNENKPGAENDYHTDVSWREVPSMGSILRCVECPGVGGDTIWVNMALAYERLPETVKKQLDGLMAMHELAHAFAGNATAQRRAELRTQYPPQEHPVVRTHPETGEKILYVNQGFTTHFSNFRGKTEVRTGLDVAMPAATLLNYLFVQAMTPEYQVRLKWRRNTVAFWDNRSTQHYAIQDYFPAVRRMERATIIGEKPV